VPHVKIVVAKRTRTRGDAELLAQPATNAEKKTTIRAFARQIRANSSSNNSRNSNNGTEVKNRTNLQGLHSQVATALRIASRVQRAIQTPYDM
jgi:hypothetical protein